MRSKKPAAPSLGSLVRAARQAAGLTQAALARTVAVESVQVSRWERGVNVPSPATLSAIAGACGRPITVTYG
jgi:transcriptional regulator with XRE-family HTH domain